jgi:hypothetical protein
VSNYTKNVASTPTYQYLECPGTRRVTIQVLNAAINIGFGTNPKGITYGGQYPPQDEVLTPSMGTLYRECDEIRFSSLVAGASAQVIITALT